MTIAVSACRFLLPIAVTYSGIAWTQSFPTKPVGIVTSAVGGSSDFVSRLLTPRLTSAFNQQFIVDNRGGGVVPVEIVAKASPDGYTLLYYGSTLWLLPLLQPATYDALRDFNPVSIVVDSPCIVAVHPGLPVKSIKELIALAKAKPGVLKYGSAAAGSTSHLAAELFKALAGVNIVRVSYNGTSSRVSWVNGCLTVTSGRSPWPAAVASVRARALNSSVPTRTKGSSAAATRTLSRMHHDVGAPELAMPTMIASHWSVSAFITSSAVVPLGCLRCLMTLATLYFPTNSASMSSTKALPLGIELSMIPITLPAIEARLRRTHVVLRALAPSARKRSRS
jgi:tripartite-type tricarboxylate transporter receptor subunit TctC